MPEGVPLGALLDSLKQDLSRYWNEHGSRPSTATRDEVLGEIWGGFVVVRVAGAGGQLITMKPGGEQAKSRKLRNVTLDLGRFLRLISENVLTTVSAVKVPWIAPFAALVIWRRVRDLSEVVLSEVEASLLWTLWLEGGEVKWVPQLKLEKALRLQLVKYDRKPIKNPRFVEALTSLSGLGCIRGSHQDPPAWRLAEPMTVELPA